MNQPSSHQN